jgi:hypothetical protein
LNADRADEVDIMMPVIPRATAADVPRRKSVVYRCSDSLVANDGGSSRITVAKQNALARKTKDGPQRIIQSRMICGVTPPIFAASVRVARS